ncbi:HXXEE domain-containing protein [Alteripontixanthobacter maritimus]|uniref:HXXEE domain-containing protein n=1 Tax=Alteripontixanthobacter maritimus TaxID=2161824 RepID=UPI0015F10D1B|nr:HXXEE domain-containing protein [Alteripontixanthobacter maritimus]
MERGSNRALYTRWLLIAIVLHNCEEVFALERTPGVVDRMREMFELTIAMPGLDTIRAGLATLALVPALILWRAWSDAKAAEQGAVPSTRFAFVTCMIAAMTTANAIVPHLALGVALGGYVPGLASAIALTLPIGVLTLMAGWREEWLGREALLTAVLLGIALLPLVLGGFWALGELAAEISA